MGDVVTDGAARRIICLNGPPGAGKDTAARILALYGGWADVKMAAPLKAAVAALFGVDLADLERDKDRPRNELEGMSAREAYIWMSEDAVKPRFSPDVFARILATTLHTRGPGDYTVSDCGFQIEYDHLASVYGEDQVRVIHIQRAGHTFANDSREWVTGKHTEAVRNDTSFAELARNLHTLLHYWGWGPVPAKASEGTQ